MVIMDTTYTNVVDASTSQIASDTKFHVAGLDLYYDKFHALKDINIDIPEKQITAFIGPSGCGKTTLLNLILGITDTDEGTIYYQEEDITKLSMEKRDFNIVFQDYALFPNLNVYQNIVYGLRNKPGLSTAEEVDALIDLLELRAHLDKKIEQLSGGQAGAFEQAH